jgi:MFS transporter, ACS family, DAL5 transporter family protein
MSSGTSGSTSEVDIKACSHVSGYFNERVWHLTITKVVAVLGFVLACSTLNVGARYFAMCLFACGVYASNSIIISWLSSTCGQTKEKKAISLAVCGPLRCFIAFQI